MRIPTGGLLMKTYEVTSTIDNHRYTETVHATSYFDVRHLIAAGNGSSGRWGEVRFPGLMPGSFRTMGSGATGRRWAARVVRALRMERGARNNNGRTRAG